MKYIIHTVICIIFLQQLNAQTWIPQGEGSLPVGYNIMSISPVDNHIIWMTASLESVALSGSPVPFDHKLKVLRSQDGGLTWDIYNVRTGRFSFDIVGVDANTAWVTTQTYGNGISNALFKTEDGGSTWINKLNHPVAGVFIRRFDDTHLLAQTNDGVATSDDGGESWIIDTIQDYLPQEFNTLAAGNNMVSFVGDTLWVGTTLGRVVRFTNYGAEFEMIYTGTIYLIQSLSFADHLHGMIFHYNGTTRAFGLSRTFDGGDTWELTPSKPQTNKFYNITHVPGTPTTFVAVTDFTEDAAEYFWTTDFGATWTGGEIKDAQTNAVEFISPTTGWVSTGNITRQDEPVVYKWNSDLFTSIINEFNTLNNFTLYPNPAKDVISYSFDGASDKMHLQTIVDMHGHIILSNQSTKPVLNIGFLQQGNYFLKIQTDEGEVSSMFVKQ